MEDKLLEHCKRLEQKLLSLVFIFKRLNKALDKACDLLCEAAKQEYSILDEVIEKDYAQRTERNGWKEWCLDE